MIAANPHPSVVICSIARLPYVLLLGKTADTTYTEAILGVWSLVEVNLGIICACAMRFKRLISIYLPRLSLSPSHTPRTAKLTEDTPMNRFQPKNTGGQHSYQLHSIHDGNPNPLAGTKDISVHRSFKVDEERTYLYRRDNDSTDKILAWVTYMSITCVYLYILLLHQSHHLLVCTM